MIEIREAEDRDVDGIRDLFFAAYGENYTYPAFYDPYILKKMTFDDSTLLLIAEDTETEKIVGTASVIFDLGALGDLAGEFGRLVVHPEARKRGIGTLLMNERIARAEERLQIGFVENRVAHPFSQRISNRYGFSPAGLLPLKARFDKRESLALFVRLFGDAIKLRRNNPRIIPEGFQLAETVLRSVGIEPDVIIDDESPPYPNDADYEFEEMKTEGYASLLRFERSKSNQKDIFGPARIHQGMFKIKATHSHYVIARRNGNLVGAIGYSIDYVEKAVKVFEVVSVNNGPVRVLFEEIMKRCRDEFGMAYIEVDVNAYAPSMQRTLLELQFVPVAYLPSFAFHRAERCDVLRMVRLFVPAELDDAQFHRSMQPIFELVKNNFPTKDLIPELADALPLIPLFAGLTEEQIRRIAEICSIIEHEKSETIFRIGDTGSNAYIILEGEVGVYVDDSFNSRRVGSVTTGGCFGETVLLASAKHSVSAVTSAATRMAVISRRDLHELIRRRPDVGVVLYKNLAESLGHKLRQVDSEFAQLS